MAIKKLLKDRYDFFKDIAQSVKQWDDDSGDATIAQEISHGLYFDAISQCIQYIEDIFALINASRTPEFFIKNIVTYNAGVIVNSIKGFKVSKSSLAKAFHFPEDLLSEDNEVKEQYNTGIKSLTSILNDLITFYKGYWFFYNQYKHGLSVPMRPFGNVYTTEQIENDKTGTKKEPYLVVYDNFDLRSAKSKGTFNLSHGVFMPGFTENVRPHLSKLSAENNYLRFVFPPDLTHFGFDILEDIAFKSSTCLNVFIYNYARTINHEKSKPIEFQLPIDYKKNRYCLFTVASTKD